MEESFFPKIDWWLRLLILGLIVMAAFTGYVFFVKAGQSSKGIVPVLAISFVIYLILSTRYVVRASDLMIVFGPFRFKYPYSSIQKVKRFSALERLENPMALKFAFSMNPLVVLLKSGPFRVVTISPADEARFLRLLATRGVKVEFQETLQRNRSIPGTQTLKRRSSP